MWQGTSSLELPDLCISKTGLGVLADASACVVLQCRLDMRRSRQPWTLPSPSQVRHCHGMPIMPDPNLSEALCLYEHMASVQAMPANIPAVVAVSWYNQHALLGTPTYRQSLILCCVVGCKHVCGCIKYKSNSISEARCSRYSNHV